MPAHRQPRLVPVDEAARLSRRTTAELRRWCATGRLRCERVGDAWYVLEDDLHVAARQQDLATPSGERAILSIAFSDEAQARSAHEQLRSRFGLGGEQLALAPLALDGTALVLLAASVPATAIDQVVSLVRGLGGIVIDGIDEERLERRPRPDAHRKQPTYG
jgi:hypothetical protein